SSRRRHTSFSRDWSSDVCSSDLQRQQRLAIQAIDPSRQRSYASNLDRGTGQIAARSTGSLGLELFQLLLQLAVALEHATELVQQILAVALDQRRGFFQLLLGAVQVVQCLLAGDQIGRA